MEIVIAAHKSVAELGVIGRAEDMHAIMDAERDATLAYLDGVTRQMGGRRGQAATATSTAGLIYAHTRHATSRTGDPSPHDHVPLANVVEMKDEQGGWKAADTALWREHLHAATMAGRVASARVAVELGYGIEADPGPSGRLGHWRIAGVPTEVMELHSKRAAQIEAECQRRGDSTYQARSMAARTTRRAKAHEAEGGLVSRWRAELAQAGWPVERLAASVDAARRDREMVEALSVGSARALLSDVLGPEGDLARRKVFSRRHLVVALAPHVFGQRPEVLERLVDRVLADPEVVPLVGVAGARERAHSLASVLAREGAIANSVARQLGRTDGPVASPESVETAIAGAEQSIGARLSDEQRSAVVGICTSGRGEELVVGVAGAGKTTMLRAVAEAFERSGHQVLGTATSGQAARNLGSEAGISESRTLASLIWRLDHGRLAFDEKTVVVLDEVGMTDDLDLVRLTAYVEAAGAKFVLTGDHHQLGPVGPGGALGALVTRHPGAVHYLAENRRQHDPDERQALEALRDGDVGQAVRWYAAHGRVHALDSRDDALQAAVEAWAADVAGGQEAGLYAWRRANMAELNRRARTWMEASGRLSGPELACPGGAAYRAGDRVVTLAPGAAGSLVTSQRAVVEAVEPDSASLVLRTDDGRQVRLVGEEVGADRLGHGYATTVHRGQGSTTARAHLFADGGGRELAYVAMSRAREATHAWVVADDLAQAADDLRRDWSARRTPTWALDAVLPATTFKEAVVSLATPGQARVVALVLAGSRAIANATPQLQAVRSAPGLSEARSALQRAEQARVDLLAGRGAYLGTDAGQAVADLARADAGLAGARREAEHASHWWARRAAAKEVDVWAARHADARRRWGDHVGPEADRLDAAIGLHRDELEQLNASVERQLTRSAAVTEQRKVARGMVGGLVARLEQHRRRLDRPGRPAVGHAGTTVHLPLPGYSPPAPRRDHGPDL
jgi:conjugative relaxase-like TrwC/TraI family protein